MLESVVFGESVGFGEGGGVGFGEGVSFGGLGNYICPPPEKKTRL